MLDSESKKKSKEVEELQERVRIDEAREDEMRKEVFGQKQRVVETEATRDILKKELAMLQRKYGELEDEMRAREKEFRCALEETKRGERKAQEERRQCELAVESMQQQLSDARIQLSGAEGRMSALEAQLARVSHSLAILHTRNSHFMAIFLSNLKVEGARKDAEFKLSSIVSSLRRTIGFRPCCRSSSQRTNSASRSPVRHNRSPPLKGFCGDTRVSSRSPQPSANQPQQTCQNPRSCSPPLNRSVSPSCRGAAAANERCVSALISLTIMNDYL